MYVCMYGTEVSRAPLLTGVLFTVSWHIMLGFIHGEVGPGSAKPASNINHLYIQLGSDIVSEMGPLSSLSNP